MISLYDNYIAGLGSNSRPLDLQSDALPTALSRPAYVVIMCEERTRDLFFPQRSGFL